MDIADSGLDVIAVIDRYAEALDRRDWALLDELFGCYHLGLVRTDAGRRVGALHEESTFELGTQDVLGPAPD